MVKASTTLKLPRELKKRIERLAKKSGRTPHGFMVEALERQTLREEKYAAFIQDAIEASREIDAGGEVFAAEDVHAWMVRLARGENPPNPKPWHG